MATGPITKDTSTLALGLAKIRIGASEAFMGQTGKCFSGEAMSIGALTKTQYKGETEWYHHMSGFPQLEDYVVALRDKAAIECAFEELTPYNLALAMGIDPTSGGYADVHSGEIKLGGRSAPAFVRLESEYTFPDAIHTMTIIFPKAQAVSNVEFEMQKEEPANVPMTFEAKRADSHVTYGSLWTDKPLGRVVFL